MADCADAIAQAGLRVTPQRVMLLDVLVRDGGHLTADDLYQRARIMMPGLSATSIYKSLHALQRAGLVREVHVGAGPLRYDAGLASWHHHRVCRDCGRIEDVPCSADPPSSCVSRHDLAGFVEEQVEVTFRGLCAECRRLAEQRPLRVRGDDDD